MLVIKATANTRKGTFITLLIPLLNPIARTNRLGKLSQRLALGLRSLLGAHQKLIVTIPAVQGLVGGREAIVVRRGTHILDLVETRHFLLVEFGRFRGENLANLGHDATREWLDGIWNDRSGQLHFAMGGCEIHLNRP